MTTVEISFHETPNFGNSFLTERVNSLARNNMTKTTNRVTDTYVYRQQRENLFKTKRYDYFKHWCSVCSVFVVIAVVVVVVVVILCTFAAPLSRALHQSKQIVLYSSLLLYLQVCVLDTLTTL